MRSSARAEVAVEQSTLESFERTVVPLLDDAYTLARALLRNEHDAQDVVQEAYLRAWRHFAGFRGSDVRPWLLAIVRNCCWTWRRSTRLTKASLEYDEEAHTESADEQSSADSAALAAGARDELRVALGRLPREYREVLVLRELQDLSYKEIAAVTGAPIGTVMSRLARARQRLAEALGIRAREVS